MNKVYAIISEIDEFIEKVCKTLEEAESWIGNSDGYRIEEVEKCCSRCCGCDLAEIVDGEFYCSSTGTLCNEIMKCPWSDYV